MGNNRKWYPILLLGLILLLVIPLAGCPQCYTQDDLNDTYQQGYDDGSHAGYEVGYDVGYDNGMDDALAQCKDTFEDGYYIGYQDATTQIPPDYWFPTTYDVGHDVSDFFIDVISLTTPVNPGEYATIKVQTLPNELLTIEVWYMSGKSEAQGLYPKRADDEGYVSWTWKVGTRTTPGSWEIIIASLNFDWWFQGYDNITESRYIEVLP
jgi:hypothetical protein